MFFFFLQLARRAVYAFLDEQLAPLERLHHAWYASYFVEGWEADAQVKSNLKDECLTSDHQRHCIHLKVKVAAAVHALAHLVPGAARVHSICTTCVGASSSASSCTAPCARHMAATPTSHWRMCCSVVAPSVLLLSEIVRTHRADEFRWPHHRKHPVFERLRRTGMFLPASLTAADLECTLECAHVDAIADLSAVGIIIVNVPPANDSSSTNSDSDGDSNDDQLDMMHATAHHDDEPIDDADLDMLSGLSDDENTDDDMSDTGTDVQHEADEKERVQLRKLARQRTRILWGCHGCKHTGYYEYPCTYSPYKICVETFELPD